MCFGFAAVLILGWLVSGVTSAAVPGPFVKPTHAPTEAPYTRFYIPMVRNDQAGPIMGTWVNNPENHLVYAVPGQWIGVGVEWAVVENERGVYNWSKYDNYSLLEGWPYWIQVKNSPPWAATIPEKPCSRPQPAYYKDFARFVIAVIDRYDPIAMTIWNEPEPYSHEVPVEFASYIGCWGDGKLYGQMLAEIYPLIKQAHPDVLVVGGELMMGNDRHRSFAEDVVKYGKFDVLSFHGYVGWPHKYYDATLEKARYLRTLTNATLWLTETSYLDDEEGYNQADYLRYLYDNALENEVELVNWYTLANNGWRGSDLVYRNEKKPAWYAFEEVLQ